MEDIGLDYSLYLHEMYISCCLKRASHVARDVHLMQMDYRVEDGRGISCSRAEGEELVSDQGFDELPAEVRTHHTFHYCAQQESKQRAQQSIARTGVSAEPRVEALVEQTGRVTDHHTASSLHETGQPSRIGVAQHQHGRQDDGLV